MRYYKPISFALMFLILAVLALCLAPGCAMAQSQPHKTFELTIDGEKVIVNLPKEFPSMDKATARYDRYYDAKLGSTTFCLSDKAVHGHVRFYYSGKDVVVLGWKDKEDNERQWLYENGVSTEVDYKRMVEVLKAILNKIPK